MDSNDFWESILLHNKAHKCIFHMVLPTIMTSIQPSLDIDSNNDKLIQVVRNNLICAYCKKDIQGQVIRNAVRILITSDGFCAFACAGICSVCSNLEIISFDSDTPMHEVVFECLEKIGREVGSANRHHDIDGLEFMRQLMYRFHANYPSFIRRLRKLQANICYYCKKTPQKLSYCSMCCYVRYCDSTCQHADWKQHKIECKFLTTQSIFYDYKNYGKRIK